MLKQQISYTDFDDNQAIETLYFNLTKSELTENLHLQKELESIQSMIEGDKRSLEGDEIVKIIDLVKTFMRLSYGVRSADGKRFVKSDEQWVEFTQTAAYDAFLFSLFEEPNKAITFMSGILPLDLRDRAKAAAESQMKEAVNSLSSQGTKTLEDIAERNEVGPTVTTANPSAAIRSDIPKTTVAAQPSNSELEEFNAWKAANRKNGAQK